MSVTPFVPPPFGPAATGALAVFNFLLGMNQKATLPNNPFEKLKDSLETFYTESDLNTQLAILAGQRAHLVNSPVVQGLPTPIEQLTDADINGDIADLFNNLGDTSCGWIKTVSDANDQIWKLLKASNTDNFQETLGSLISGITLQLLMENASIMIKAIDASVAYRHKEMDNYGKYVSSWTARVQTVANDIGNTHVGAWDKAAIKDGLEGSSRIPQIEAWMAQAKEQRLNQISDVHEFSWQQNECEYGCYP